MAVAGNPSTIPGSGQAVLYSNAQAFSQDGLYTVSWSVQTSLGSQSWPAACNSSLKIVRRPFLKVFYGGLASGGQFGSRATYEACGDGFAGALGGERQVAAFIAGHAEGSRPSDARGSSSEYTLQALGAIGGFYSASQRSLASDPDQGPDARQ